MTAQPLAYKILIVDDAAVVREALRWRLDDEPDLRVVGEAADGDEALQRAAELSPDAVILDVELPGRDGFAVARLLKQLAPPPAIIFLSIHGEASYRARGLEAGGDEYVEKSSGWNDLVERVRQVLAKRPR